MIASVRGAVSAIGDDHVVVEVGGVGLLVFLPEPSRAGMRVGDRVALQTYLAVREGDLSLYGFETLDERDLFVLLMGVSGVGPRLALAALSTLTPDAMRRAVHQEQAEIFSRVPGVGRKTAQKILLHLQDRVPVEGLEAAAPVKDVDTDLLDALTGLGYSVVEAQAALQSLPRDAPEELEARLRLALSYFS